MKTVTASDVKNRLGDVLLKCQREPITINKNGKPVAVVVSAEEYKSIENLKLERLKARLQLGLEQTENGEVVDGEQFFEELLNEATP